MAKFSMAKLFEWYSKLDKEALDLLSRLFMKGLATGNLNAFLKDVCKRELGEDKPKEVVIEATVVQPESLSR